ncbi:phage tail protein [Pasteurella multocida]|nr:phage tail protein [Pasteurella multocida]NNI33484.1 phage tail protein [Pasteurella multocida]
MIQEHKWQQVDLHNWNVQTFHWAVAFVDTPSIYTQITTNVRSVHDAGINVLTTSNNTKVDYVLYEHGSINQGDCRIQFLAIGRWR